MSIKEVGKKSNPLKTLPNEEEFDIVSTDFVAQNKVGLGEYLIYGGILVLMGGISFGIGKLVTYTNTKETVSVSHAVVESPEVASPREVGNEVIAQKEVVPEKVVKTPDNSHKTEPKAPMLTSGPIVASKNGSKYYLTSCSGAKRISDVNKIFFASEQDAKQAGLTPSSTCKGLKK